MPTTKKAKATAAEMEQRTTAVLTLLLTGAERPEIVAHAAKKWEIGARSTDTLIKRARELIAAESEQDRPYEIGLGKLRMNQIYKKSMAVKNYSVAIAAQRERHALFALYQPQTIKIIGELLTPQAASKLATLLKMIEPIKTDPGELFDSLIAVYAEQIEAEKSHEQ